MAATTAMCTAFKAEIGKGTHNFSASGGDTFKMALIDPGMTGTYGAASTSYTNITGNSDEVSGTGYTTGGAALTNVDPTTDSTSGIYDFSDNPVRWASSSISARAVMLYNDSATSPADAACAVWDFGETKTSSGGNFDITLPAAAAGTALLEFA